MNDPKKLLVLSILAFKEKQYENAASLFVAAMDSGDLDSLVDFVDTVPPTNGLHDTAGESENTLSPSLSSSEELNTIVDVVEQQFRSESSLIEDGDEVVESLAQDVEDDFSDVEIVASAGPIKLNL